ncbi:MAG: hypothetical protein LBI10_07620 [Deltaproteobacteria bacterium]|nr:hypothetical protein [Deltaproteobacteria bacterium]
MPKSSSRKKTLKTPKPAKTAQPTPPHNGEDLSLADPNPDQPGDDSKTSLVLLKEKAGQGDVPSLLELGNRYDKGSGVYKSSKMAREYFRKAANLDSLEAHVRIFETTNDDKDANVSDKAESRKWLQKAAGKGYPRAQYLLGIMSLDGQGFKKDVPYALELLNKAWEGQYPLAATKLGIIYFDGQLAPQDFDKAKELFQKAADLDEPLAINYLGRLRAEGLDGEPKDLDKAIEYYQKSAAMGDDHAQYNLGLLALHGQGLAKDVDKALDWLTKSAEQNNIEAQRILGLLLTRDEEAPPNVEKGLDWLTKAAEKGDLPSRNELGVIYYYGEIVPRDLTKAEKFLLKAANSDYEIAKNNLTLLLENKAELKKGLPQKTPLTGESLEPAP